ncbi:hypothetical protein NYP18_05235 [Corynebacterium sp. YIM 101645]|uniref:Uncharacterized protein n=1 Tax=Corynebacterium lemuris TaxID=1859292 RepID=A0ABT2FX41_9CORY|nr:hypothetical protein [Corynebacterium lemuris]MCS5479058.1 hypothetical protein [Corynebacterium lemuris]
MAEFTRAGGVADRPLIPRRTRAPAWFPGTAPPLGGRSARQTQARGVRLQPGPHGSPDHPLTAACAGFRLVVGHPRLYFTRHNAGQQSRVLARARALPHNPHSEPALRDQTKRLRFTEPEAIGVATVADVLDLPVGRPTQVHDAADATAEQLAEILIATERERLSYSS